MPDFGQVFQKLDTRHNPVVLKAARKPRAGWDAEIVLDVLLLCVTAALAAVLLKGAGLI